MMNTPQLIVNFNWDKANKNRRTHTYLRNSI